MFWTRRQVETLVLIAVGGFIGANARYLLTNWAAASFGNAFPWGTLLINLTGSCLLAIFIAFAARRTTLDPRARLFLAVGFCGAYTTFSTYATDSITLLRAGNWMGGLGDILGTNAICIVGVFIGLAIGSRL